MSSSKQSAGFPPKPYYQTTNHLREAYVELYKLTADYPLEKQERPGACGVWSPKQILAHLSGWLEEAGNRFSDFYKGDISNRTYNEDAFNATSVESRAALSWEQTRQDFIQSAGHFLNQAFSVRWTNKEQDPRYFEWVENLLIDCREHSEQIRHFLQN